MTINVKIGEIVRSGRPAGRPTAVFLGGNGSNGSNGADGVDLPADQRRFFWGGNGSNGADGVD